MNKMALVLVLAVVCTAGLVALDRLEGLHAAEAGKADLSAKIDDALDNQQTILQKLDEMAEQIQIVKIRATR